MGVWIKSAVGLGSVYFAMFGPALHSSSSPPATAFCARAALAGDTLQARFAAAACAQAAMTQAQRLAAALAVPAAPAAASLPSATSATRTATLARAGR